MTYTNNVPQGNQTIAFTTDPIRNNFAFLENSIGQEHNFNAADPTQTYHLQAAMPNSGGTPAMPGGANGVYYVDSSLALYYDNVDVYRLNCWSNVSSGVYTPTSNVAFNDVVVLPANVQGIVIFTNTGLPGGQIGTFLTNATNCFAFSSLMKFNAGIDLFAIELNNNAGGLALQGRFSAPAYSVSYTYKIFYRPA